MPTQRPPGLVEIFGLPILGVGVIEALHNRTNELFLFFAPFALAAIRLFIAQFQVPTQNSHRASVIRAVRNCIGANQVAVFVLVLLEAGAVLAVDPTMPQEIWVGVGAGFGLYVALRLLSRHYWIAASGGAAGNSATRATDEAGDLA